MSPESKSDSRMLEWLRQSGHVDEVFRRVEQAERQRRKRRKAASATAAALILILAAVFWGAPYVRDTETIATQAGRRQVLALRDGSRAELNASTELFTDFRGGKRAMRLNRGEAYFAVAKDAARPFTVETPGGTVTVTGTEFNVRIENGHPEVTLIEGTVEFSGPHGTHARLSPGQQIPAGLSEAQTLDPAAIEGVLAWRQGRAVFNGTLLAEAVAVFARYHGKTITVAPEARSFRIGGSYQVDSLPGFLGALEEMLPVKVVHQQDGTIQVFSTGAAR